MGRGAELLPKHAGPGLRKAKTNANELERYTAASLTACGQLATQLIFLKHFDRQALTLISSQDRLCQGIVGARL